MKRISKTTRKKRATAILTDIPVKAALRDKQSLKQVTKENTTEGEQETPV
jgi:hypothetical protein